MDIIENKEDTIAALMREPLLAHRLLFKHRHANLTPDFHREIIELWHDPSHERVLIQAFRGAAKSTLAEEAIIIQAFTRRFHNAIILGETYERAVERLRAIKHEVETNPLLNALFGDQVGPIWSEAKIQLNNGAIIQAFGRGQSLRGSKHFDHRPDVAFADDIENEDSTATPEAIEKCKTWLLATVLPALEPASLVRINGTPLHPRSVICQLAADPGWISRVYPIMHIDPGTNLETPTWPDRFDLDAIARKRADYARLGMSHTFAQEFMCQAEDPASKPFTDSLIKVEPAVRTWQAVYAMCDPARSTGRSSASTGMAVWSWIGNRLIVWDAFAGFWQPDRIVHEIFEIDRTYAPVAIGVERDGLEEFILQPLRHEQVKRGCAVPIRPLRASAGKLGFITALQPYFKAGEVIFAKECPQAREQFLNFPSGRIDIPNALAYALTLRPGQPVYDAFNTTHVVEVEVHPRSSLCWCALNSDGRCTTAVLVQPVDGALHVIADRAREGEPSAWIADMLAELRLEAGGPMRLLVPPVHYNQFSPVGLVAALRSLPAECTRGGDPAAGRAAITSQLNRLAHGRPALQVSTAARWTLNAFAGGYCRELNRQGQLMAEPSTNTYAVLMTGLESFAAVMRAVRDDEEGVERHYAFTPDGRKYLTSRPAPGTEHGRR
jgi:hypothetical protein